MYDLIIRDGRIIDGTGKPGYTSDIAVKNGTIGKIGMISGSARKEISAEGLTVIPGIIDMHSHADLFLLNNPGTNHRILQGVTTEIVGNCGFSAAPLDYKSVRIYKEYAKPIMGAWPQDMACSFAGYSERLCKSSLRHNVGALVGCGAVRVRVNGFESSVLKENQMNRILELLGESLKEGALGASLGLMYVPEAYFTTQQLVKMASIVAEFDKVLAVHIRGEGSMLVQSIDEIIEVAQRSGVNVHISHLKAASPEQWGKTLRTVIKNIDNAREKGTKITADVYPYSAGSTTILSLLPPWAQSKGTTELAAQLSDNRCRQEIIRDMRKAHDDWDNIAYLAGWDKVIISSVPDEKYDNLIGKDIQDCADEAGTEPDDYVLNLICEKMGSFSIIIHSMNPDDVDDIVSLPYSSIISDSIYSDGGRPHPRMYGSFARLFGEFVRKRNVLTLEEAVRKCTSMPADCLKLHGRGTIAEGTAADLTIFDAGQIIDQATYVNPRQYPAGICGTIVNGNIALWQGEPYKGSYGSVLKG